MDGGGVLNVLAIEPYCGGRRREFVRLIQRHSRHRWDWRTLPPRRMHRRLASAAEWFVDELNRHPPSFAGTPGVPDVLLVTEAIYLNELLRQVPALATLPRGMYVHDHGTSALPPASREYDFSPRPAGVESIHLLSAVAATIGGRGQLWFASSFHAAAFLVHADEVYRANQHLFSEDPRHFLEEQARVVPPPVARDGDDVPLGEKPNRRRIVVCAETSDGGAVAEIFARVMQREEPFELLTIGSLPGLGGVPHVVVDPGDATATAAAIRTCRAYLAMGRECWFDPWAVRALRAEVWPLVPALGRESCYDEVIPRVLHRACFHDGSFTRVLNHFQTAWHGGRPELAEQDLAAAVAPFDPETAVREIDDRLEQLARGG